MAHFSIELFLTFSITSCPFLNIPSPLHGASTKHTSKQFAYAFATFSVVSFVTITFFNPILSTLEKSILLLEKSISLLTIKPLGILFAIWIVFPPGAAHRSSTYSSPLNLCELTVNMALGS